MKKHRLIIDVEKCENCNNCFLACKDEHVGNEWPGYAAPQADRGQGWVFIQAKERGKFPLIDVAYLPTPCMHCDPAPCVKAGNGAVTKRPDGIVLIDTVKSKGMKELIETCPYGAITWNEAADLPQKCTLCAHLLDKGWKEPRCVQSCPTGALKYLFLEDGDMGKLIMEERLEVYRGAADAAHSVFCKNLYRFTRCFIGGSLATRVDGREECVEGASVSLFNGSNEQIAEGRSDPFGDFKFDNLPPHSGTYVLSIAYKGHETRIAVELTESVNAGTIFV